MVIIEGLVGPKGIPNGDPMDSRLIFLHIVMFLWRDGVLYLKHLIGLVLEHRGGHVGKSAWQYSEMSLKGEATADLI